MATPKSVLELAKKAGAKMVDIKFVDTFGTWQHFTMPVSELSEDTFAEGLGFDGSSIRGWKSIEASDMLALPDPATAFIDPDAHDAYLRGRYLWFTFNIEQTLPYFEKALQLQPDYAAAWSGLADTYMLAGMGFRPPQQVTMKALEAARKAVELDDSLPEAHNSIAAWYLLRRAASSAFIVTC